MAIESVNALARVLSSRSGRRYGRALRTAADADLVAYSPAALLAVDDELELIATLTRIPATSEALARWRNAAVEQGRALVESVRRWDPAAE